MLICKVCDEMNKLSEMTQIVERLFECLKLNVEVEDTFTNGHKHVDVWCKNDNLFIPWTIVNLE